MPRRLKTDRTPEQTTAEAKKARDLVTGIIEYLERRDGSSRNFGEVRQTEPTRVPAIGAGDRGLNIPAFPAEPR